jgi:hypothetical protein
MHVDVIIVCLLPSFCHINRVSVKNYWKFCQAQLKYLNTIKFSTSGEKSKSHRLFIDYSV